MIDVTSALIVLAVFFSGATIALSLMFAASLRRAHPDIWRAHASPLWVFGRNAPWPLLRFMHTPVYRRVRAQKVLRLGRALHFVVLATVLVFAALVASLAWPPGSP